MEEFIMNNVDKKNNKNTYSFTRYKKAIVDFLMKDKHPINILNVTEDGHISFEITVKDLGFSREDYDLCRKELFSSYSTSYIGEILIRDNIEKFIDLIKNFEDYDTYVNGLQHKRFGFSLFPNRVVLVCHASLIQYILSEDFIREANKIF